MSVSKKSRQGLVPVIADSIKPPAFVLDSSGSDNHTYKCVYVTSQGKQVTQLCTHYVWKRCEGRNITGRPRDGLADKLHSNFVLWVDKTQNTNVPDEAAKGIVVDVDVIPETYYNQKAVMPEDVMNRETVDVKLTPNGGADVVSVPPGIKQTDVIKLLSIVAELETLEPGEIIDGNFEVVSASGIKASFLPPSR